MSASANPRHRTRQSDAAQSLSYPLGPHPLRGSFVIQPVAPMSIFGVLSDRAHGHVVTTVLVAMIAMLFTAISYGRMARVYPSAGSAFTYVGKEINPAWAS